jgi:predicted alpha/beta hydrolase family esterase
VAARFVDRNRWFLLNGQKANTTQNKRPIVFVGHSLGGLVIKEVPNSPILFTLALLALELVAKACWCTG